MINKIILFIITLLAPLTVAAESVTYRIVEYNASVGDFTLSAWGEKPKGSYAIFENEYGATTGNRYNQIPRNRQATLWLEGWQGCTITKVTLWMCSNNKAGQMALIVNAGERTLYTMSATDFASDSWFGTWVSKDLQRYVELSRTMSLTTPVADEEEVGITIKGGHSEGSVYVDAITIDYSHDPAVETESPMGYIYEKLEKKSTLAEGDVVMLYRSGDAAGDIDGMETSHYLDAIGLASTRNVYEPFVETFTLAKTDAGHWTMTNGRGQRLGACGVQHLAWDEGVTEWDITLGYDGATIASTNAKYGTMRYNAPAESYPRFWNYTSTSLPLPYIYRRTGQVEPVAAKELILTETERTITLIAQDTLLIGYEISPATTTDKRVAWLSSDENVAVVKSGIVFVKSAGETTITASTFDVGASATYHLVVQEPTDAVIRVAATSASNSEHSFDLMGLPARTGQPRSLCIKGRKKIFVR